MQQFINNLVSTPKRIFLVDAVGALVSAFFLWGILGNFNEYFGMDKMSLDILATISLFFSAYSFCTYFFIDNGWRLFLRALIIANLLYCCSTAGLVIYYYPQLTYLALAYFGIEIVVILGIVFLEIRILNANKTDREF